ncbi:MAG: hypothetical protein M0Z44_07185 [Gammaproteobacteria bacterium]|nr:hypothetical protein [Gammaproteobacteria bacterium]
MTRTTTRLAVATGLLCAIATAHALTIKTPTSFAQAAKDGGYLFMHGHFGTKVHAPLTTAQSFSDFGKTQGPRMTCATCHADGRTPGHLPSGRTIPSLAQAAALFPRVTANGTLRTLPAEIRHCVRSGIQGRVPSFGGPVMVDLEAYLASIARGTPLAPNGTVR